MTGKADPPDPSVQAALDALPDHLRPTLLALRDLILETVADLPRTHPLLETLKWGQPSYLPQRPRVGSTIRLGATKDGSHAALFFHCQTSIISDFRAGPGADADLGYDGNRAILLDPARDLPRDLLRLPIRHALTYHLKRTGKGADS